MTPAIEQRARELCRAAGHDPEGSDPRHPKWRMWHVFVVSAARVLTLELGPTALSRLVQEIGQ